MTKRAPHRMCLQQCGHCETFHYPPVPRCPCCLQEALFWKPLSGKGTIFSRAVFHRSYLPAYQAPYHVIAVRLTEGPSWCPTCRARLRQVPG